jgi:hypothetical protein
VRVELSSHVAVLDVQLRSVEETLNLDVERGVDDVDGGDGSAK